MTYFKNIRNSAAALAMIAAGFAVTPAQADIVHLDDVIIQFSLCVGNDCVNGESFGFDTLRLKENNLRIHFQDTSNSASFPAADWRIVANDTSNGGANYLAFEDSTTNRQTFRVNQGAPANALVVDSQGDVGIGVGTPVTDIHIRSGNTPTVRLEQDGSSGFTPQIWDMAGNESNFFIRDATNGSALAFRIEPGADESAIYIEDTNDIGFGTSNPDAALHVSRAGDNFLRLENRSGNTWNFANLAGEARIVSPQGAGAEFALTTAGDLTLTGDLILDNPDFATVKMIDASTSTTWNYSNLGGEARIISPDGAGVEFALTTGGNLTITGNLTQGSDANNKTGIVPVDNQEILAKVAALPVSSWSYKWDEEDGVRHIGPMAQDFYAAFGTGASETGISTIDTAGVALAAIQALTAENAELKARLDALESRVAE